MNTAYSENNTIDELLRAGATATATCRTCGTVAHVDLEAMRAGFGGGTALRRIGYRVICTGCGAADCTIRVKTGQV
jgi:hypothetical protein